MTKKEKEILHDLLEKIEWAWGERTKALSEENAEKKGYAYACGYGYSTLRDVEEAIQEMLGLRE